MNSIPYYIISTILNIFGVYIIYSTIKIFHNNIPINKKVEIFSFVLYYLISNLITIFISIPIVLIIFNLLAFFTLSFNYNISYKTKIALTLFTYVILTCCEVLVVMISNNDLVVDIFKKSSFDTLFLRVSTLVFQYIIMLALSKLNSIRKDESINLWYWLCIVSVPATTLYTMFLLLSFNQDIILAIFGIISMFLLNFFVFHFYDYLVYKAFLEKNHYIKQSEGYVRQFELIRRQSHSIEKVAHEMKDHLLNIINLVELKQNKDVIKYVQDIVSVEGYRKDHIDTGNLIIDSTINVKKFDAELLDIELKTNLFIPVNMEIDQLDIAMIIGNVLDYAINKTKLLDIHNRKVNLAMRYEKDELSIRISNSSLLKIVSKSKKDRLFDKLVRNKNAFKITSIEKIVAKYQGKVTYVSKNEEFDILITLLIDLNNKNGGVAKSLNKSD